MQKRKAGEVFLEQDDDVLQKNKKYFLQIIISMPFREGTCCFVQTNSVKF